VVASARQGSKKRKGDECLVAWAEARGLAVWIDRIHSGKLGEGGWGNPHKVADCVAADAAAKHIEVCERYAADIAASPELQARIVAELAGKVLLCWCYPRRCHGDSLARIANGSISDTDTNE
jgi:hypothetical protein